MACLEDNDVVEFVEGLLSAEKRAAIEAHLVDCETCRRLISTVGLSFPATNSHKDAQQSDASSNVEANESALLEQQMFYRAGTRLGDYSIIRAIGRGGMGEVYLARDTRLGRKVALKLIRPTHLASKEAREQFLVEAQTTARFAHPHIITIFAAGEHEGRLYLALEYLEGETLQQRIQQQQLSARETLRVGLSVVEALRQAHENDILHLDLKPSNIMLPKDGRLRVLDFGLARSLSSLSAGDTTSGSAAPRSAGAALAGLRGSPPYMSPEQWRGEACTTATDIWALGVVLYRVLSGQHPYGDCSLEQLQRLVTDPTPVPRLVPPDPGAAELLEVIGRCLAKKPSERPTADDVMAAFQRLLVATTAGGQRSDEPTPFPGLLPFSERDSTLFFGREYEVEAFLDRLRDHVVVPIAGPSGMGKSSFVQAGIIPRLKERSSWLVLKLRPGRDPFSVLANRLLLGESSSLEMVGGSGSSYDDELDTRQVLDRVAGQQASLAKELLESPASLRPLLRQIADQHHARVLLFVDQLEELFTQVHEPTIQDRFVEALCTAVDDYEEPVRVIVAVRDDFLYRLAQGRDLLGWIAFLPGPTRRFLEQVLTKPLEAVGYHYDDPALVKEIIGDVQLDAACLPLIQFSARMLWQERDVNSRQLRRAAYENMGGVGGALARHADGILARLSPVHVRLVREMLLRLVTRAGTRQALPRGEVFGGLGSEAEGVLDRLVQARLLSLRRPRRDIHDEVEVELIHETLIGAWGRLSRWVDERREGYLLLAEVTEAAELWQRRGCQPGEIWHGAALAEANRLIEERQLHVPPVVRRFVDQGMRRAHARKRRARIVRSTIVGGLAAIAVASLVVAWAFNRQRDEALRQRERAMAQQRLARHRLADAQRERARLAIKRGAQLEARALLRSSLEIEDSLDARSLWHRLDRSPLRWRARLGSVVYTIAFSPDGRRVFAGSRDQAVRFIDVRTRQIGLVDKQQDQVLSVAASPDGQWLAIGHWDGSVVLRGDGKKRRALQAPRRHGVIWALAFSPDNRWLAAASSDQKVHLWELSSGALRRSFDGHHAGVRSLSFSPDSRLLASGSADHTIRLWDLTKLSAFEVLEGHRGTVTSVCFGPVQGQLASSSSDGTLRVWKIDSVISSSVVAQQVGGVFDVAYGPKGRVLASANHDHTIAFWDVPARRLLRKVRAHEATITRLRFSPNGRFIASASYDGTVALWGVPQLLERPPGPHSAGVLGVAFSPDGKQIASGSADQTIRLWDATGGNVLAVLRGHRSSVSGVAFNATGRLLASSSYDQTVRLWKLPGGSLVNVLRGHRDQLRGVVFSPDGQSVASFGDDRSIRLWSPLTGRIQRLLRGHQGAVLDASFSPDGRRIASASADHTVRIWPLKTAAAAVVLKGHEATVWGVAFDRTGRHLVSASADGTVRWWNLERKTGRVVLRHRTGGRYYWLAVHPSRPLVGVPSSDGQATLLSLNGGPPIHLRGHRGEVDYLRFSPNGHRAVTTGDDGTVRLWNVTNGRPLWRSPFLARSYPRFLTHRGWHALGAPRLTDGTTHCSTRWQHALAERSRFGVLQASVLCLLTDSGSLELWNSSRDRRLLSVAAGNTTRLVALHDPPGCAALRGNDVFLHQPGLPAQRLAAQVGAIGMANTMLLAAGNGRIRVFDATGQQRSAVPFNARGAITSLTVATRRLVVGMRDGRVIVLSDGGLSGRARAGHPSARTLAGAAKSTVLRLVPGPPGTVVGGFANGVVALWDLQNGRVLDRTRLHGAVAQLVHADGIVHMTSELGDYRFWDLRLLRMGYRDLLERVVQPYPGLEQRE